MSMLACPGFVSISMCMQFYTHKRGSVQFSSLAAAGANDRN